MCDLYQFLTKVLLSYYVGNCAIILLFCLIRVLFVYRKEWHGREIELDYFPLAGEDALYKMIDERHAEENGDSQVPDDSKHDAYRSISNWAV